MRSSAVSDETGYVIGYVTRKPRPAAGGGRKPFWTATPWYPDCPLGSGGSLGTRFPSRERAETALREFHAAYPPALIEARAAKVDLDSGYLRYWRSPDWLIRLRSATITCADEFKRVRYNHHRPTFQG